MRSLKIVSIILVFLTGVYAQDAKIPLKFAPAEKPVFVENQTVIAEVKFTGLDSDYENYDASVSRTVYESDFLKVLRENRTSFTPGETFNARKVEKIIRLLKEWMASEGYLKADVTALGEKLPKNRMTLTFVIKRDDIVRVSEILITGNYHIPAETFISEIKTRSNGEWQIYDRRKYGYYADKWLRGLMHSQGFFKARIVNINPKFRGSSYSVTIRINEGVRYLIGKIKFAGSSIFTQKELLEWSEQEPGVVADGKKLRDFVFEKLKRRYYDKGFLLYNAEFDPEMIEPEAPGLDGTVNVAITIEEGPQFKVNDVRFSGIDEELKAGDLKELLGIKKGDIYSQTALENGIRKINETKNFFEVNVDRDVDMQFADDTRLVSLVIKMRRN